jgi:hypothetical protein
MYYIYYDNMCYEIMFAWIFCQVHFMQFPSPSTLSNCKVHIFQVASSLSLSLSLSLSRFYGSLDLEKRSPFKIKLPSRLAELHWHMLSLLSTTLLLCKGMMSGSILKAMTPLDFPSNNHNLLDELLFHESTAFHPWIFCP